MAEIAAMRGHTVEIIEIRENHNGVALTQSRLAGVDAVLDFTTPDAVMANIEATVRAGVNMVVGTTGWYAELPHVRNQVERANTGFIWASNFSIGVNLFFAIVREARQGHEVRLRRPHHRNPSHPQARRAQRHRRLAGKNPRARRRQKASHRQSVREGEVVGTHSIELMSAADTITLTHEAHNRRGFAEGAVRAAEWVKGKRGFYEFQEIFSELKG